MLGIHLLVVDDDATILHALERTLRNEGYRMSFASSAEEAHEMIRHDTVHVIVSDYQMAGMSGLDLLERLRAEHPSIIRILMTAHADQEVRRRADAVGVHSFIEKPWHIETLKMVLKDAANIALRREEERNPSAR